MRLTKLRHVVMVEKCGSITAAANKMNTAQSTVTKSVAATEDEIGYALFNRNSRGVVSTVEGRNFLIRAAKIVSDLDELIDDSSFQRQTTDSILRIGVCPSSLQGLLNRSLVETICSDRSIRIHLTAMSIERGIWQIQHGEIDVLIVPEADIREESGISYENIAPLTLDFFVRIGHDLTKCAEFGIKDIVNHQLIVPGIGSPHADVFSGWGKSLHAADPMRDMHIIEYFPVVAEVVAATNAIGIVSSDYASTATFRQRFCLLPSDLIPSMKLAVAWRVGWDRNRAARRFQDILTRQ